MKLLPIFGKYVVYSGGRRVTSCKNRRKALTIWACNNNLINIKTALKRGLIK